jgi:hypothetical protein
MALAAATGVLVIMKWPWLQPQAFYKSQNRFGCSYSCFRKREMDMTAATDVLEHVKWLWLQPQAF